MIQLSEKQATALKELVQSGQVESTEAAEEELESLVEAWFAVKQMPEVEESPELIESLRRAKRSKGRLFKNGDEARRALWPESE